MLAITILAVIVIVASLAYNSHIKSLTFGRGWNGEVKAILKDGRIVELKEAGADFESFFFPGATRTKAIIHLTRYILDKNDMWMPDYKLDNYLLFYASYLQEEIREDGLVVTVIDSNRGKAVGYRIDIKSQYPFETSNPETKYIFTDMQWHSANYSVAIK